MQKSLNLKINKEDYPVLHRRITELRIPLGYDRRAWYALKKKYGLTIEDLRTAENTFKKLEHIDSDYIEEVLNLTDYGSFEELQEVSVKTNVDIISIQTTLKVYQIYFSGM